MYTLHIANKNYSSWSLRPWVLLSELGIPFEERLAPFLPGSGSSWTAFRAFSPTGRVPCLHADGEVVWDSLAIAEYLAENHAGVWPSNAHARAWARSASAEMHSGFGALRNECPMNCGLRVRLHQVSASLKKDIERLAELWNEGLRRFGGPFLAGKTFGAVDAFYAPVAFRVRTFGLQLDGDAAGYARRLCDLPSMQRWLADALAERWRDPEHEDEIRSLGEIVEDLRAT
ncbi:glutathione S-transferase family protein [Rhodanobacter sp. L36]|uniref:glutathione S-transferase family protein n=1 Tax=Rhodanobacter sp. L36 TaxID=1747221 RepID=UPI00131C51F6|nr:glutathione S-transferase family protein [Rhodanobacter sp. L36]